MAWSVHTWKILRISQSQFYQERSVPKHATAHIHKRCAAYKKSQRSVKHIWFLPTLKPNAEKPKELALSQPTIRQ